MIASGVASRVALRLLWDDMISGYMGFIHFINKLIVFHPKCCVCSSRSVSISVSFHGWSTLHFYNFIFLFLVPIGQNANAKVLYAFSIIKVTPYMVFFTYFRSIHKQKYAPKLLTYSYVNTLSINRLKNINFSSYATRKKKNNKI